MKIQYKVLILSCILANFMNVQASDDRTQKSYEVQIPNLLPVIDNADKNRPSLNTEDRTQKSYEIQIPNICTVWYTADKNRLSLNLILADYGEPTTLKSVGYSNSEIYNKMVSERIFALSIAAMTYPPAMAPIALSLYRITNSVENTGIGFAQDAFVQIAIKAILSTITKQ